MNQKLLSHCVSFEKYIQSPIWTPYMRQRLHRVRQGHQVNGVGNSCRECHEVKKELKTVREAYENLN